MGAATGAQDAGVRRFARSFRDTIRESKRANDLYADLAGKPRLDYSAYNLDKPKRAPGVPKTNTSAPPLERDILKAVWKYLVHHPRVAWVTRINSGTVMADFGADGVHPLRMNYKRGISDLIGQMRSGAFLAVEVKREGAQLIDHQREFLNEVLANNGVAFVARSVGDAERALQSLK